MKKLLAITMTITVIGILSYKGYCNYYSYPKPHINIEALEQRDHDELNIFFKAGEKIRPEYTTSYELTRCKDRKIFRRT
jgi:hypothetical protein